MNSKTKKIVTIGALIAAQVIAGRFLSISLPLVKIGFAFLPLSIIAILYGPVWSGIASAVSDFLVAMMSPFGYDPLLTIPAILSGVIYGVFLYRKPCLLYTSVDAGGRSGGGRKAARARAKAFADAALGGRFAKERLGHRAAAGVACTDE